MIAQQSKQEDYGRYDTLPVEARMKDLPFNFMLKRIRSLLELLTVR